MNTKSLSSCIVLFTCLLTGFSASAQTLTVFTEDWESGQGDWDIDNGVWEIGAPAGAPDFCQQGTQCAGTVQNALYPANTDSRLISPSIALPSAVAGEEIQLRFWQWFSYGSGDFGIVQISVFEPGTGFTPFEDITSDVGVVTGSGAWSLKSLNLTQYAERTIKLAFYHIADGNSSRGSGWFVDDIQILRTTPEFTGDFEDGWSDWHADRGVWEVGTIDAAPDFCREGAQCAGTVLEALYPANTDSRLISPTFVLPDAEGEEVVQLRFWQWFSYGSGDFGTVQISVFDQVTGFSDFENIASDVGVVSGSGAWSLKSLDLTEFAGRTVRLAFYHIADGNSSRGSGWFVDGIEIVKTVPQFTGDFEDGWTDWHADRGVWEVGSLEGAPDFCNGGALCAGTVLDSLYPANTDSRLISPSIDLPSVSGPEELRLRFWHWFSFGSGDRGDVQISTFDDVDGWSAWDTLATVVSGSGVWTSRSLNVTTYAGQRVRVAFYHIADGNSSRGSGWYVDDVRLPGVFNRPCEADFDNDGDVDGSNLATFSADFGRANCSLDNFCRSDFDHDGDVDGSDLATFAEDFGETACFEIDPF